MKITITDGHRIAWFLIALIVQMLAFATFDLHAKKAYDWLSLSYCLILTAGPFTIIKERKKLILTVVWASVTLIFHQLAYFLSFVPPIQVMSAGMWVSFNILSAYWFFYFVQRSNRVGNAQIYAAVCVYILIALGYAAMYAQLQFQNPQAFTLNFDTDENLASGWATFVYFSFTTLTTVGFGDITPKSMLARYITVSEAIIGVFYVAILISRLISLQMMHRDKDLHDKESHHD